MIWEHKKITTEFKWTDIDGSAHESMGFDGADHELFSKSKTYIYPPPFNLVALTQFHTQHNNIKIIIPFMQELELQGSKIKELYDFNDLHLIYI